MAGLDMKALGGRIAHYRRLNKMSAEDLAARSGAGLTRDIIANIETGRRKDIGVTQLMALAVALQVPLVALLLPITTPDQAVLTTPDLAREGGEMHWTALHLLHLFQGWTLAPQHPAAKRESLAQLAAIRTYGRLLRQLEEARARLEFPQDYPPAPETEKRTAVASAEAELQDQVAVLHGLGVEAGDG
ncbi:XRE family transcriptional regulator [Microbacterium bovistercoris]|uniref:XRE family transcriptional regulator n=1 Tax=Microbacterium bovistercoris TaxID=2293570 RepID=A0A371NWK3_9MICO|nr:helix-turn-helix domain-containing protein [Microbacterium bovistercoris]REJ06279.1 XRE family transcriptional regulator [Microbacterium bovistercoris]